MFVNILDGKMIADKILMDLKLEIKNSSMKNGSVPGLAIVLAGDDPSSLIYIHNKIKAAKIVGIKTRFIHLAKDINQDDLIQEIKFLNEDPEISGIIMQLPLPLHIDKNVILKTISPSKDVDGFHPTNIGLLSSGSSEGFIPCTAIGCLKLLKSTQVNLSGKHAVIVGRSNIVGKPLAALLLKHDCTVTICHSKTEDLKTITKSADILIAAIGVPRLITTDYVSADAIVIDVGISRDNTNSLVGDVDFVNVQKIASFITPVPGGVGPMTVACLLTNCFKAYIK